MPFPRRLGSEADFRQSRGAHIWCGKAESLESNRLRSGNARLTVIAVYPVGLTRAPTSTAPSGKLAHAPFDEPRTGHRKMISNKETHPSDPACCSDPIGC